MRVIKKYNLASQQAKFNPKYESISVLDGLSLTQYALSYVQYEEDSIIQLEMYSRLTPLKTSGFHQLISNEFGNALLSFNSFSFYHQNNICSYEYINQVSYLYCLSFIDKDRVLVSTSDLQLVQHDIRLKSIIGTYKCEEVFIQMIKCKDFIIASSQSGKIYVKSIQNGFKTVKVLLLDQCHIADSWESSILIHNGVQLFILNQDDYEVKCLFDISSNSMLQNGVIVSAHIMGDYIYCCISSGIALQFQLSSNRVVGAFKLCDSIAYSDLSSNGQLLLVQDGDGVVHLVSINPENLSPRINLASNSLHLPTPFIEDGVYIDFDDNQTPLNSIGLCQYSELLSSGNFPQKWTHSFTPSQPIPAEILGNVKWDDYVGYAPYTLKSKRNEAYQNVDSKIRFKSDKERELMSSSPYPRSSTPSNQIAFENSSVASYNTLPAYYKKPKILYSRLGVEDFDFEHFNQTRYSGLENDLDQDFLNSLIQSFLYLLPLKDDVFLFREILHLHSHPELKCKMDPCLLCELSFMSQMFLDAKGKNCQATNFLNAFRANEQVVALGLYCKNALSEDFFLLLQNVFRWLIEHFQKTLNNIPIKLSQGQKAEFIKQIFGVDLTLKSSCTDCHSSSERNIIPLYIDLINIENLSELGESISFHNLLEQSIKKLVSVKAWCDQCKAYKILNQQRTLNDVPIVMSLLTGTQKWDLWRNKDIHFKFHLFNDQSLDKCQRMWKDFGYTKEDIQDKTFIPSSFSLDKNYQVQSNENGQYIYDLTCMITSIQDSSQQHLVSYCQINDVWYLFNDFEVRPVSHCEVLQIKSSWKNPVLLQYTLRSYKERQSYMDIVNYRQKIQKTLSFDHVFQNKFCHLNHTTPLTFTEFNNIVADGKQFLVGIDAEFVSLAKEEVEYRSDGSQQILKPKRMQLARISLLRGQNPQYLVPFVDDYIQINQPIEDYLTEFSGIVEKDLDPSNTKHKLVQMKHAYHQLRTLIDQGAIFVGHGLKKDFRTINIFVPENQVIDTVNIYRIKGQRNISLRFLAWYVLGLDIQSAAHDSVIDARTALMLYEKYLQLEVNGKFAEYLDKLYDDGRKTNWKNPSWLDSPKQLNSFTIKVENAQIRKNKKTKKKNQIP